MFSLVSKLVPASIRKKIKRWRKKRSIQQHKALKEKKSLVTKDMIFDALSQSRINPGSTILIHSSLSEIGPVQGGAPTVVDALFEYFTSSATILMPAYPHRGSTYDFVKKQKDLDLRTAPSTMGAITECFRLREGVLRSNHPTHCLCAIGPLAAELLSGHELSQTPCGKTSPFYKLSEMEASILHIGTPLNSSTSCHVLEDKVDSFPIQVYLDELFPFEYVGFDGVRRKTLLRIHDPAISRRRADARLDHYAVMHRELDRRCSFVTFAFGNGKGLQFGTKIFQQALEDMLKEHITVYE